MEPLTLKLNEAPVVPLVQSDHPETAIRITQALVAGGLSVVEVVLRTPLAMQCLEQVAAAVPEAIVGAGTVLSADQASESIDRGARFIVSPGLHEAVVATAQSHQLAVFPGVSTASELQLAWNLGLRAVKFFPASHAGGIPMMKALHSAFSDMKFMPTGGVSAINLGEFLAQPFVLACGGSWLTPKQAIAEGDYGSITQLAREAIAIASAQRRSFS